MLSSTFTDLKEHRRQVREVIEKLGFKPEDMESHGANAEGNVIESSLQMVRDSAAYVGIISHKYGQTPVDPKLNAFGLSITELEFNEAMRLDRPILLFIMGDKHPLTKADVETDPDKIKKLDTFRERAKRMREESEVERVYEVFEDQPQFVAKAAAAIGRLIGRLETGVDKEHKPAAAAEAGAALPRPPELAALPKYLGSHKFVGRDDELRTLNDWCGEADPNPMLLFEAMGGSGKSMLTWEWLNNNALSVRGDWAGRFWFSFYEKGAVMAGFCREALAYMTGKPVENFARLRTPQLADLLVAELDRHPWLLVLDGLERVLVAYQRADAAQLADEKVDESTDPIEKRDPCTAIRPEDDELLRRLAAVVSSKILVTSRLTPHALMNRSGMAVPGVRREFLRGLRPGDAEAMIRSCGIDGDSKAIQRYLQSNCDCHPLVIGVLAGLINTYPVDPGNFDRWVDDPRRGGALDLGKLDLFQRKNHILKAAIDALEPESRRLLQTLSLLKTGADYDMLKAFNPHMPPEPAEVAEPNHPEKESRWQFLDADQRAREKARDSEERARRQAYLEALAAWKNDPAVRDAPGKLDVTIRDLEKRGLLQFDRHERRYDLHPVVRGVAVGGMQGEETQELGQKVVDHFNSRPHNPWEQAETLADIEPGLEVVRVLLRMGNYKAAAEAYQGDLCLSLLFNLDARAEILALLQPFFPDGWSRDTVQLDDWTQNYILSNGAMALADRFPDLACQLCERMIALGLRISNDGQICAAVRNLAARSLAAFDPAEEVRLYALTLDIAEASQNANGIFRARLDLYACATQRGDYAAAERLWQEISGMKRPSDRAIYRQGEAEFWHADYLLRRGELTEEILVQAETAVRGGHSHHYISMLYQMRGEWYLRRGELSFAIEQLGHAVRKAREADDEDIFSGALLALARLRAGDRFDAHAEAERLSKAGAGSIAVAELWRELGDRDRAIDHALRAHEICIGDGEPFVFRHLLDRTRALLSELGAPLPEVPKYDPAKAKIYPWEKDVRAFIEKLKAERTEKEKKEAKFKSGKTKTVKRKPKPEDKPNRGKRVRRKKTTE
jgi:tetratricopeptide (TPR) repeat protein